MSKTNCIQKAFDDLERLMDARIREQLIDEVIELSDKIEIEDHTTLEEWKAFKRFRNTLRERYLSYKQK